MISERLAVARRLELSDAVESGDRIEGRFAQVLVNLEDHGLERTVRMDMGRVVRWVSITARGADINDPDVVVTGEREFDDAIVVLAEDGAAPTVGWVFGYEDVRARTRELFRRFPLAAFKGATLTIPTMAADNNETTAALQLGSKLVLMFQRAIDKTPTLTAENAPALERGRGRTGEPVIQHPARIDPEDAAFVQSADTSGILLALYGLAAVLAAAVFTNWFVAGAVMVVAVAMLLYWLLKR